MVMLGDLWPRSFIRTGRLRPARSISVAKEWRLFRPRNSRHYAGSRTIPGELKLGLIGGSLASIFPA
jgi:hypothetical protein